MTIEEIKILLEKDRAHENDHIDCNCDMEEIWRVEGFEELADACEQLLRERDEALAKAEVYRALACQAEYRWEMSEGDASKTIKNIRRSIDAEAARILERSKGEGESE